MLNAYFYPENIAFSHLEKDLLDAFVAAGFEIDVITPMPTRGISDEIRKQYKKKKYEEMYDGKVKIHRFFMFGEGKNPIIRAIRYILCNIIEYFKAIKFKDCNIIFSNSTPPTQGILCSLIKKCLKVPFIYNLQDIFPDSMVNTGMCIKGSFLYGIGNQIANYAYKNSDKIIVISEDFKQILLKKGIPEEKIELIYNWVDENTVVSVLREKNKLFDEYGIDRNKFYISYSGNIGMTQNMNMLLEVAEELKDRTDIGFILVGDGAYKKQVAKWITEKNLTNVTLIPFQPYECISEVFSLGDVGLIISKAGVGSNSVPSKTWSYMSAERPILACFDTDSELYTTLNKVNCGVCVEADDKSGLKQAILDMAHKNLQEQGRNSRKYILENLTKKIGTKRYEMIIGKLMEDK